MSDWKPPLLLDDDPFGNVPEEWRTVTTETGEILELHPTVARMRMIGKQSYERRRLAYCEKHGREPDGFRGCVDCGGTGKAWVNNLPCHCPSGTRYADWLTKHENEETKRLLDLRERKER